MRNIWQHHKLSLAACLLGLFVICWAIPLQASDHSTAPHAEEEISHSEHGQETAHTELTDTHEKHAIADQNSHGSSETHGSTKHESGHDSGGHAENAHGSGHHAPPPFIYYIYWGLLVLTFIVACFYCLWVHKHGKPKHEGLGLAFLLVLIVIALYSFNQLPEVQRHFNPATHQFVDGYHESPGIGFIKFIYKMGLGICLMIYGLIGREDH